MSLKITKINSHCKNVNKTNKKIKVKTFQRISLFQFLLPKPKAHSHIQKLPLASQSITLFLPHIQKQTHAHINTLYSNH